MWLDFFKVVVMGNSCNELHRDVRDGDGGVHGS